MVSRLPTRADGMAYVRLSQVRQDVRASAAARLAKHVKTMDERLALLAAAARPVEDPGLWVAAREAAAVLDNTVDPR